MIYLIGGALAFAWGYYAHAGYSGKSTTGVAASVRGFLNNALGLDDNSDDSAAADNSTGTNDTSAGAP